MKGATTRLQTLATLAGRPEGVSNAELQAALRISAEAAGSLLCSAELPLGLYKVPRTRAGKHRMRWFIGQADALRLLQRIQAEEAAAKPAKPAGPRVELRLKNSRPPRPAPQRVKAAAAALAVPPVVDGNTKVTRHEHQPEAHRINLFAAPLPPVPGWGRGPVLREGALDYKRHQRHGGLGGAEVRR